MFRRRIPHGWYRRIRDFFWPRSGWRRSSTYVAHRIGRLPGTSYSIAAGFACGAAVSFTPLIGFHFALAALLALLVRGNLLASALGTAVGVLPGLGPIATIAMLLPITFGLPPVSSLIMLAGIYYGAQYGGSTTAILINLPGESSSVVTAIDGYQMAKQGRAGPALATAALGSFFAGTVATVLLVLAAPPLAEVALQFGPAEFFAVQLLTFCSFVGMGKEQPFKVLTAMMLGFALAAVGLDSVTGQLRMTFGSMELLRGFDFLIAVIGLFGIGEILLTMEEGLAFKGKSAKINAAVVLQTWKKLPRYWATAIRGSIVGCWMGITPGGATPASFMSYGLAKRFSRNGANFGKGEMEGVVAPETAAHAAGTSALLPMLTLGIPGSPTAAVLLGGLLIWGLQPGPLLFVEQKEFVWGLIASMYLGNVVGLIVVLTTVPLFASILRIPFSIIAPVIIVICAVGAYTVHNAFLDIAVMLVFGVLGYIFKKLSYPLAPLVLALVLGDMAESSFRQAMLLSQGDLSIFWSNPLVGTIVTLALAMLFWPVISLAIGRLWPRSGSKAAVSLK